MARYHCAAQRIKLHQVRFATVLTRGSVESVYEIQVSSPFWSGPSQHVDDGDYNHQGESVDDVKDDQHDRGDDDE